MTTEAKLDAARAEAMALQQEKDKYAAANKAKARKLRDKVDALAAELVAEVAVAGMSEAEQQAIAAELTKVGDA